MENLAADAIARIVTASTAAHNVPQRLEDALTVLKIGRMFRRAVEVPTEA